MLMSLGAITTTIEIRGRRRIKILMMEESTAYHAKNMDHTHVRLETWYSGRHKNMLTM
jgi:hypothetical protein